MLSEGSKAIFQPFYPFTPLEPKPPINSNLRDQQLVEDLE